MDRRKTWWVPAALAGALILGLAACGGGGPRPQDGNVLGSQPERARRLYAQLKREHSLDQDRRVLVLAHNLLDYYPDFPRNDEVRALAIDAARNVGEPDEALGLVEELVQLHPDSPRVGPALDEGIDLALASGDTLRAAGFAVEQADRFPSRAVDAEGVPRAAPLLATLPADDLALLQDRDPEGPLAPYLGYQRTLALVADDDFAAAESQVVALEGTFPDDRWTVAAREALTSPLPPGARRGAGGGVVRADRIGLLSSLTGRYAVLGNACVEAALLAVQATERETGRHYELLIEDTASDPVTAALAARRLCAEDGAVALVGALASAPTVAAALVAGQWGVPLVSPTATNDRVWTLNPGVFQTNLTGAYEIRLLARLVTRILLKRDCAILRPDTPEGASQAALFAAEVEALGGRVVHEAVFDPRATDFRAPILALRATRPEVVFVPASRDQMALVGPQLDFFHLGSLVLGLSNLNDRRLLERTGAVLEGVVFPDDLALFPAAWTAEFAAGWDPEQYPDEADDLALKFYQGTRMVLDTLARTGATDRAQLVQALQGRLAAREIETEGPASYGGSVRIVRDGRIEAFPADIFVESWALTEGARADSLAAAADSAAAAADTSAVPAPFSGSE